MDSYYPPYELVDHIQHNIREFKRIIAMFVGTGLKVIYMRVFMDGRYYILIDNMPYIIEFGKFTHSTKEVARAFGQDITSSSDGDWNTFCWYPVPRGAIEHWHWLHDVWNGTTIFKISPHGYADVYAIASTRDNIDAMESFRREKEGLLKIVRHLDCNMSHVHASIKTYKGPMFSFGGGVQIKGSTLSPNQKTVQLILARMLGGTNDMKPQEAAIFYEIGRGLSAQEIATKLGFKQSTVQ